MKLLLKLSLMAWLVMACGTMGCKVKAKSDYAVPDSLQRTMAFLTKLGISPDTLALANVIDFPEYAPTTQGHWLVESEAEALGMRRICGVDGRGTLARLVGVGYISRYVSLLMFQVFYTGWSPVVLVTYDSDGAVIDMMDTGLWNGVNTRYAEQGSSREMTGKAVESGVMTWSQNGGFSLARTLAMIHRTGDTDSVLWTYTSRYDYRIDPTTGVIQTLARLVDNTDAPDEFVQKRELEEVAWTPIQDEAVMERFESLAQVGKVPDHSLAGELFRRMDVTPWVLLEWLYEHPQSKVRRLFDIGIKECHVDSERLDSAVRTVQEQSAKRYWREQFNI